MAQVAGLVLLVVRLEVLGARPVADGVADGVAEVGREPAALDLEHLVPAAGSVEAERRAVGCLRERVLELVPVVEDLLGRHDRLERRLGEAADALQGVAHLVVLGGDLRLVVEVLEAAAAAGGIVRARGVDPVGTALDHLGRQRLGVVPLHLGHAGADEVAREPAADEDDEAVQPSDAVPAVGERLDPELDLLILGDRGGHAGHPTVRRDVARRPQS